MRFLIPETFYSGGGHRSACNPSLRFVLEGDFSGRDPCGESFPVELNGFKSFLQDIQMKDFRYTGYCNLYADAEGEESNQLVDD